jgi:hypothetical protein
VNRKRETISFAIKKKLLRQWDRATFATRAASARWHYQKHGWQRTVWQYLAPAEAFGRSSAATRLLHNGDVYYSRRNGEFLIERRGLIVTYGINR